MSSKSFTYFGLEVTHYRRVLITRIGTMDNDKLQIYQLNLLNFFCVLTFFLICDIPAYLCLNFNNIFFIILLSIKS